MPKRMENRMGRPPTRQRYRAERSALRELIRGELEQGQNAERLTRTRWSVEEFDRVVGAPLGTVKDWLKSEDPAPPRRWAKKILEVLYGDRPEHATQRGTMQTIMIAAGVEHDEFLETPRAATFSFVNTTKLAERARVVRLRVFQPIPQNETANISIPFDLTFHQDRNIETSVTVRKKDVKVTLSIALTRAHFVVEAKEWHPAQDSIFGRRGPALTHTTTKVTRAEEQESLEIVASESERPVEGDPFQGIYDVTMEPRKPEAGGSITFSVKAPRDGIEIAVQGASTTGKSAKDDVINALFATVAPPDPRGWFVVDSETVDARARKDDT
jgi:hypothetical protein